MRGKAIMPDLSKLMLHRIAGDLKSKAARNKDQETNPGAAVPKPQGQFYVSPALISCLSTVLRQSYDILVWSCEFQFTAR